MKCLEKAKFRFTWPGGEDEEFVCERHIDRLLKVANALGSYIELIPLDEQDSQICSQKYEVS